MCTYVYACGLLYMCVHMHVCSGACISVYVRCSVCVWKQVCNDACRKKHMCDQVHIGVFIWAHMFACICACVGGIRG